MSVSRYYRTSLALTCDVVVSSAGQTPSLIRDEVDHVEPDVAVVPHVQVSLLWAVRKHCQHPTWGPEFKGHVHGLLLQQVKGKGHSGVFAVRDVQDAAGDEGVPSLGAWVGGVDVGGDGEGLLVQLGHHDVLVRAGSEDQPQTVLIRRQFEVGLGVVEQVGQVLVQGVVDGEGVEPLGVKVKSVGQTSVLTSWSPEVNGRKYCAHCKIIFKYFLVKVFT